MARKGHGQFWHRLDRNGLVAELICIRDDGYVVTKRMKGGSWHAAGRGADVANKLRSYFQARIAARLAGETIAVAGHPDRARENGEGWYDGEPARDAAWRNTKYNYAVAQRIMRDGYDTVPRCGCRVEPDGKCSHGGVSRLRQWGMI